MEIEFTKEQYENLLKLAYVGNFVINGLRVGEDEINEFNEIEEYLYQFAEDFDLGDYVAEEDGEYFPSDKLEESEEIEEYLEDYNEEIFWTELGDRLAIQAILDKYDDATIAKMSHEDQFYLRTTVADQFEEEFEKSGLENVKVMDFEPDLELPKA